LTFSIFYGQKPLSLNLLVSALFAVMCFDICKSNCMDKNPLGMFRSLTLLGRTKFRICEAFIMRLFANLHQKA